MLGRFSLPELLVLLVIVLILFGANRLPELAGSIGKTIRAFKEGLHENDKNDPPQK
jgi:sec-independent protein translocase protein TatA